MIKFKPKRVNFADGRTSVMSNDEIDALAEIVLADYKPELLKAPGKLDKRISEQIEDIYGFEASGDLISKVTDKILPQIEEWQQRTLSEVYPIVFIDAIIFNVRKE